MIKKLDKKVVDLLLPRMKDEYSAFYFYRAASNWCQGVGFFQAAKFFAAESQDELEHAKKIEKYITDWNVIPELPTVNRPQIEFSGIMEVLEEAYKLEYDLYEAYEETSKKLFEIDLCAFDFLQPLRLIQNDSVSEYSDKLNLLEGVDVADKFKVLLLEEKLFSVNG
jgi:ferritin